MAYNERTAKKAAEDVAKGMMRSHPTTRERGESGKKE